MTTRPRVSLALLTIAPLAAVGSRNDRPVQNPEEGLDLPSLISNVTGALQLVAFLLWLQITYRRLDDILNCCEYALERAEELLGLGLGGANDDVDDGAAKGSLGRLLLTASGGFA